MELKTQRLTIRFVEESDWQSLLEIWADFGRSSYSKYDVPHNETEAAARAKAKRWREASPGMEHMFFAVLLDRSVIGCVDFHKTADGYECGYCFHSRYHGMGYAKESIVALIEWLAAGRKTRFTAGMALANTPSVKLLSSLGFIKLYEEQVSFYKDAAGNDIYFTGGVFALDVN